MPLSLLIIEDDEDILRTLYAWFEPRGFLLDCARNGHAAFDAAMKGGVDCIVLDVMLPGLDGFSLCERLRAGAAHVPVIIITARDSIEDRVRGLELGADDYLVKPFSLRELEARIHALMRRPSVKAGEISFSEIKIIPGQRRAFRNNSELKPGPAAYNMLELLTRRAPDLVRKEELERLLWGEETRCAAALRNHIFELRKILDKPFAWPMLETIPHVGYRLRDAPE